MHLPYNTLLPDGSILLKYRNMNKAAVFSLLVWSKGRIDSFLKIGGV